MGRYPFSLVSKSIVILSSCYLTGCLSSSGSTDSASTSNSNSDVTAVVTSSKDERNCSNGKQAELIYSLEENKFYTCDGKNWVQIEIRGAKGEQGLQGPAGVAGAVGPAGPAGARGADGRNGIDGVSAGGVPGLAIMDGSSILAYFLQYATPTPRYPSSILNSMLVRFADTNNIVEVDPITGKYISTAYQIHYMTTNCTGKGFVRMDKANPPNMPGRVYVATDASGNPTAFWRATELATAAESAWYIRSWIEYREDGTSFCRTDNHGDKPRMVAEQITALPDLRSLAPLQLSTH